jgi:glycosyltransferase involved in cell wall biosynthesis
MQQEIECGGELVSQLNKILSTSDPACLGNKNSGMDTVYKGSLAIHKYSSNSLWRPNHLDLTLPKVAVLLCTYHGQPYLAEQLDSFAAQDYPNWQVWASDDGSEDNTLAILETYRKMWGGERLSIHTGPTQGSTENFLSLTCKAGVQADYYAYSDQDDIWENDKLDRAINWLMTVPEDVPALYCSRTRLVDSANQDMGFSPLFNKPPSFANALIQNIAGGNTMVFNDATCKLLREVGTNIDVVTHDWWVYMVVSGCGGKIFYDEYPSLRYRQHDGNQVGMNSSWFARLIRFRMLLQGNFRSWNDRNLLVLQRFRYLLTPENQQVFDRFANARNRSLFPRLIGLEQSGIYRQTLLGNLGLVLAAIFKKI